MSDDFQIKRKLTAILSTDAVSYSRMMSENEDQTLRILADQRRIVDAIIEAHEGRIVNTAGDSVLAEFSSSVAAVRCAIEMQEALKTRNDALPSDQRMLFRIGINLGDVMISGTDLLGDGVNVAARLQSIAEPGGICISSSVYDQISGKINLGFADLGEQNLKNITRPIHVYQLTGASAPIKARAVNATRKRGIFWVAAGFLFPVTILALGGYFLLSSPQKPAPTGEAPPQSTTRELEQSRLDVERGRAQAELEKLRAEGEMARMQAELELEKARTEAEQIKRRSEAEARSSGASASRAEPRAGSGAPSSPLPVAAQEPASRPAEPPAKPADAVSSQWIATLSCEAFADRPEIRLRQSVVVRDGGFVFERGEVGQPGYVFLQGRDVDGQLTMVGNVISAAPATLGQQGPARLSGSLAGSGYVLKGKLGRRPCSLALEARQ
jgi:class 3 adenylate cyclase